VCVCVCVCIYMYIARAYLAQRALFGCATREQCSVRQHHRRVQRAAGHLNRAPVERASDSIVAAAEVGRNAAVQKGDGLYI